MMVGVEIPPVGNRVALEQNYHGVCASKNGAADHQDAQDPDVYLVDGDTEKEEPDRDFAERRGECLEYFTEEPIFQGYLCIVLCEEPSVLSGSVSNASDLADEIDCV